MKKKKKNRTCEGTLEGKRHNEESQHLFRVFLTQLRVKKVFPAHYNTRGKTTSKNEATFGGAALSANEKRHFHINCHYKPEI